MILHLFSLPEPSPNELSVMYPTPPSLDNQHQDMDGMTTGDAKDLNPNATILNSGDFDSATGCLDENIKVCNRKYSF